MCIISKQILLYGSDVQLYNEKAFQNNIKSIYMSGADPGFQVRGGALKKIAPNGGRREKCWGISCEKTRFYAKKWYSFQLRREARKMLGYFVWKITILRPKNLFFFNFRGGGRVPGAAPPPPPPPGSAPACIQHTSTQPNIKRQNYIKVPGKNLVRQTCINSVPVWFHSREQTWGQLLSNVIGYITITCNFHDYITLRLHQFSNVID